MSEVVKNYPLIRWDLPGLRPLQVGLILALVTTSVAGILSNPLFTLANNSVANTPMLRLAIAKQHPVAVISASKAASLPKSDVES